MERDQLDQDFVDLMLEVENLYNEMNKHEKIRVEQWSKKLCQVTSNLTWKKNRNKYANCLLEMVKLGSLQEPFTKLPPDGPLPQFQQPLMLKKPAKRQNSQKKVSFEHKPETKTPDYKPEPKNPEYRPEPKKPKLPESFETHEAPKVRVSQQTEEIKRLKAQLEISQFNEKYLRDEVLVSSN